MSTSTPLAINIELTGVVPRRADNGHVPISLEEIDGAVRCVIAERQPATSWQARVDGA